MQAKDDIKEMAQTFREAADILDEIAELDDKEGLSLIHISEPTRH